MLRFTLKRAPVAVKPDPENVAEHKIHYKSRHNGAICSIKAGFSLKRRSNSSKMTVRIDLQNNF